MSEKYPAGFDPETAELARMLEALDFSEETSIRESLRERLVERGEELARASLRRRWIPVFAPVAGLAAVILSLFIGVPMGPAPLPEAPQQCNRLLACRPVVGKEVLIFDAIGDGSESDVPAVALGARSDLDRLKAADIMETVRGEEVVTDKGRAVRWRLGKDVFILESRILRGVP
ncbi:MAG: hypothetical protein HZB91_00390 [Elusimicrobia bacterium]|nr:hypothetical protein [Elusimicrobiota bacterium]